MAMFIKITIVAAGLLAFSVAATASPAEVAQLVKPIHPLATPLPKFQPVDCRFWQCNCHRECIVFEGNRCVQSYRTCDTCSSCKD
jgi:hypothetical protein